jgi:hypothetical protein
MMMLRSAILGAFLLAAAQWLTGDGGKHSRVSAWLLLGDGVVAAVYAVIFQAARAICSVSAASPTRSGISSSPSTISLSLNSYADLPYA